MLPGRGCVRADGLVPWHAAPERTGSSGRRGRRRRRGMHRREGVAPARQTAAPTLSAVSMTTNELREAFQAFFEERGHLRVPPHSLIPPADDQTTLFIVAGMQQFKPYFLRTKEPPSNRVVSVQPCLRAGGKDTDLEDVGRTDRHNSFFEMMGNFSFGDYFKDEAVDYAFEWVTRCSGSTRSGCGRPCTRATPCSRWTRTRSRSRPGNASASPRSASCASARTTSGRPPRSAPAASARRSSTTAARRVRCGDPDCGPGHCDRYMEIYNLVFMEYDLQPGNVLARLPSQNVDTGMGVERTAMVLQDVDSNFDTDGFRVIMDWVERESGVAYRDNEVATRAHRVIADHGRAVSFLIAEGVVPANEGRGYICRRLLRRAIQHANRIGLDRIYRLPAVVIEQMGDAYPYLREQAGEIERVVRQEEERFSRDARARPEGVRGAGGQACDLGRRRVHARRDLRLPDRADAGARRGARPARRPRWIPVADGAASRRVACRRREHDAAGRCAARRSGAAVERVRRVLEDVGPDRRRRGGACRGHAAVPQARAVTVLRGERRPGQRHRLPRRRR